MRGSVTAVNTALRGTKRVDLFECARVDPSRPIEDIIRDLQVLVKEGLFDHIGMSECNVATLRRANAVYPITIVEIEVSPWSYEEETKKGAYWWVTTVQRGELSWGRSYRHLHRARHRRSGIFVSRTTVQWTSQSTDG